MHRFIKLTCLALAALSWVALCSTSQAATTQWSTILDDINACIANHDLERAQRLAILAAAGKEGASWLPDYVLVYQHLERGELELAESSARRLYKRFPDNPDIRHTLAMTLLAQGKRRRAMFYFKQNLEELTDPAVKADYEKLIESYDKTHKPYGVRVSVGAEPSSNINNGTQAETVSLAGYRFILDDEMRQREGVNITARAEAFYTHRLTEDMDVVIKTLSDLTKNVESDKSDIWSLQVAPSLRMLYPKGYVAAGPVLERIYLGYKPFMDRAGFEVGAMKLLSDRLRAAGQIRFLWQDYDELDYRDGNNLSFTAGLDLALTKRLRLSFTPAAQKEKTERDHLDFSSLTLGGTVSYKWPILGGLNTSLGAQYMWKDFRGDHFISGKPRLDRRRTFTVSLSSDKIQLFKVIPTIGLDIVRNDSSINIYQYDSVNMKFGLGKSF